MNNIVYTSEETRPDPYRCTCEAWDTYYNAVDAFERNEILAYPATPDGLRCETYHQYPSPSGW
jgi:hypothetical protein